MGFAEDMGQVMGAPRAPSQACNATRVIQAGGDLVALLLHPSVTPFERIWRRLPSEGIHLATRARPFTFEVGAYRVPGNMALLVAEYKFDVFRFNGASPWDMVPMETRRLPLSVGYDLNFDQYRKGNLQVEILPVPAPTQQEAFTPTPTGGTVMSGKSVSPLDLFGQASTAPPAITTVYDSTSGSGPNAAALSQASIPALGAGNALLPQDQEEQQEPGSAASGGGVRDDPDPDRLLRVAAEGIPHAAEHARHAPAQREPLCGADGGVVDSGSSGGAVMGHENRGGRHNCLATTAHQTRRPAASCS
jgi:hypothetical protein